MDDEIGVSAPESTCEFLSIVHGRPVVDVRWCMNRVDLDAAMSRCSGKQGNERSYLLVKLTGHREGILAYLIIFER
ncbi:hypothetical protein COY32_00035 [candidate division WWE3 bacterium CG_4_10_14_0_2_um_filter_41_14]|uniref:Uncharacterized protein n=1 Tax=candidate division WWE3 bacterium CG_4_10_14_0_2_um_filter_41_14 TaxID=1975072 RepID=A0A2M7TM59_UNCKA|nr:MAG: hypothetical protein COY32_00035 [candidate division WWE3 bacterium CG_4_10_14_0_2_um_filter_41_14]